jgi:hypothetical protein
MGVAHHTDAATFYCLSVCGTYFENGLARFPLCSFDRWFTPWSILVFLVDASDRGSDASGGKCMAMILSFPLKADRKTNRLKWWTIEKWLVATIQNVRTGFECQIPKMSAIPGTVPANCLNWWTTNSAFSTIIEIPQVAANLTHKTESYPLTHPVDIETTLLSLVTSRHSQNTEPVNSLKTLTVWVETNQKWIRNPETATVSVNHNRYGNAPDSRTCHCQTGHLTKADRNANRLKWWAIRKCRVAKISS